jgi:hypothetical protein
VRATGLKDADKFGALIRRVQKGKSTAEDADALLDLVAKSAALVKGESMLFTSIGKAKGEGGDEVDVAKAKLDEATAAIQKAKPTITKEAAYMEACEANPDAYAALRNGPRPNLRRRGAAPEFRAGGEPVRRRGYDHEPSVKRC